MPTRAPRKLLPRLTDRLPLGREGLAVSPFCLGRVDASETILAAFDAGLNFFFLSTDMHWPLYEKSRQGLRQLLSRGGAIREQVVVGAACYLTQPVFCARPFEEVLYEIPALERIDVLIAGGAYSHEFLQTRLPIYQQHQSSRFVGARAIGGSFHDRKTALRSQVEGLVDIAFSRYNPSHFKAREELFPYLSEASKTLLYNFTNTTGVIDQARYPELELPEDVWRPKLTDYYRFALTRPEIDGLLCSPALPAEVEALAAALEEGPLNPEEEEHMISLAALNEGRTLE